jgi:hypothetical protein
MNLKRLSLFKIEQYQKVIHMQLELGLDDQPQVSGRLSDSILKWLARTYETLEEWKTKAKDVFFLSNGDSNLSRNRVAFMVRTYFLENQLESESVQRWKPNLEEIETKDITPPKISASNAAYIDWLYIADYLLLACATPTEELDEENNRRKTEFRNLANSYNMRLIVHDSRKIMQQDATLQDKNILTTIKKTYPKASLANIKEARRLENENVLHIAPKEPIPTEPMHRYTSLYF